jgi:peroxiredoxin
MSLTPSTMMPLDTKVPAFSLPDTGGNIVTPDDFKDENALLVVFMCNHCPYVKHIIEPFVGLVKEYQRKGVGVVGINSNDVEEYPDDSPANMILVEKSLGFTFPYLYDEDQEVAKTYGAACTPDFFLFDSERKLVYRGQLDSSRPGNDIPITGKDLRTAMDEVLEGKPVTVEQRPSPGCNIKWKPGNEPDYFLGRA